MQVSESPIQASAVRAELIKESLAERLEFLATNLEKTGAALADKLHDLTGTGAKSLSSGLRTAAQTVRQTQISSMFTPVGESKESRIAVSVAMGLGAGLFIGLLVRKLVR